LSPSLRASHHFHSVPVRKGDTVRVLRGDRKGLEGKVTSVDQKNFRVFIEGVTREKVDGTTTLVPIHPSKVMITGLSLDDRWRRESLKAEAVVEEAKKPEEKQVEEEKKPEVPKKERKKKKTRKPAEKKRVKKEKTEGSESG
jgi:large subunit ribosomal protein L24